MKTQYALLSLLLFSNLAISEPQRFLADLHLSQWQNRQSRFSCELKHDIPHYGTARFYQASERQLAFDLHGFHTAPKDSQARLHINNPNWQHGEQPQDLWQVPLHQGKRLLQLNSSDSRYLLQVLEQGLQPSFHYTNQSSANNEISVALSNVNFLPALQRFQSCLTQLYPDNFTDLKTTHLLFASNSDELNKRSKQRLNKIISYLKVDHKVKKIQISGHTDKFGGCRYNLDLSEFRSFNVHEYLLDHGVAETMIKEDNFGEKQPLANNTSATGRAKNRRVTVRLVH
ncbi:MAG: OmpA family protein [Gammaproteobacteria bacterium]|nr:OmpA family protein [Gammaproteobacteria bacterium]